jgi:hypothetical protein
VIEIMCEFEVNPRHCAAADLDVRSRPTSAHLLDAPLWSLI